MQFFGPPVIVAINKFPDDTDAEVDLLRERVAAMGANVVLSDVWAKGGEGGVELAEEVVRICEASDEKPPFRFAYELGQTIPEKIEAIATKIYGADGVDYHHEAKAAIERYTRLGYATLPVCMAKTQSSLSDDKKKLGRPTRLAPDGPRSPAVGGRRHDRPGLRQDDDHARAAQASRG